MDIVTAIIKFENESNSNSREELFDSNLTKEEEVLTMTQDASYFH